MAPYSAEFQPNLPHPSLSPSGSSFSSSIDTDSDYEAQLAQGVLYLAPLPVILPQRPLSPYDQAIPTILHEVTGTEDLESVLELKLKVLSSELSLSKLHLYVPQLRSLDLSGSCLQSLRDLGCNLSSLSVLTVDRCGLDSLDGLFGLSSLTELSAAYNRIEDLSPAIYLEDLKRLNLRGNSISDLSFLEFLSSSPLEDLTLAENPASSSTSHSLYSETVLLALPGLKNFDGKSVPPQPSTISSVIHLPDVWAMRIRPCPHDASPLTSPRLQSARPGSAGPLVRKSVRRTTMSDVVQEILSVTSRERRPRPLEFGTVSRITSGGVVCGNLTNSLSQRRRRTPRAAEGGRGHEEEMMRVVDVEENLSEDCAVELSDAQENPPTSSGVRESTADESNYNPTHDISVSSSHNPNGLIVAARRWRQAFVSFQEKSWESWQKHSMDPGDASSETDSEEDQGLEDEDDTTEVSK